MTRVPEFRQSEMVDVAPRRKEMISDVEPLAQVIAMGPPSRNCCVGPEGGLSDNLRVVWAFRCNMFLHFRGISFPECKDVDGPKASVPKRPRPALASFDGGVVLYFGRLGRIEHYEQKFFAVRLPDPRQRVSVGFAI